MRSIRQFVSDLGRPVVERRATTAVNPSPLKMREVRTKQFTPPAPNQRTAMLSFETNPFVHSMIDRISTTAAMQTFYLKRRKGDGRKIVDHPALDFLHSGNEVLDGLQCRRLVHAHLDLAGEAFLLIGRDSDGRPASYLPIPPIWVTKVAHDNSEQFELSVPRTGGMIPVPWSEMIWIKRPRPFDPTDRGYSPTRALTTEIALNEEIATYFYSFVKNRARPDIIVTGTDEAPMSEEDARAMEASWAQRHGGSANAGKPLFSNVPIELHEVGQTVQESRADEMRKLSRDFISEVYGVPPEIVGRVENSNRATAEAADFTMARYVIEPRLVALCSALYPRLLMEFPDLIRMELHAVTAIREDKEYALNVMRAAPSAFKKNEARAMAGLEPIEGGDDWLQEDGGGNAGTDANDPNALADGNTDSPKKSRALPSTKVLTEDDIDALMSGLDEDEVQHTSILIGLLRLTAARAAISIAARDSLGSVSDLEQAIEAWAVERAAKLNADLAATTAEELSKAAREAKDDRGAISAAILLAVAKWTGTRTNLVAGTEANGAVAAIEMAIGAKKGDKKKVWLTRADERVRGLHRPMHGQIKDISQPFESGNGETAMGPGGFKSAENNVNCRCGTRTFSGDAPTDAQMNTMIAMHEGLLRSLETELAVAMAGYFAAQAQSVLRKLGSVRP